MDDEVEIGVEGSVSEYFEVIHPDWRLNTLVPHKFSCVADSIVPRIFSTLKDRH